MNKDDLSSIVCATERVGVYLRVCVCVCVCVCLCTCPKISVFFRSLLAVNLTQTEEELLKVAVSQVNQSDVFIGFLRGPGDR